MGWLNKVVVGLMVVLIAYKLSKMNKEPPLPTLDPNPWWAPGEPQQEDVSINRFNINFSKKEVDDLKARLALPLRLTPGLEDANFTYGINADTLHTIVQYWRKKYDWNKRQTRLNTYPHFKTRIEGLDIHFMRASAKVGSAKNVKVVPLLLIHGWPGSFVEFYDILPLLTNPQEGSSVVFEVICPSIPGYGFSQGSSKQGFGQLEVAQVFLKLMKRLGYKQFYLQGGDWGSLIASNMATMYPNNTLGVHLNMISVRTNAVSLKMILGAYLPAGVLVAKEDQDKIYPLSNLYSMILRESGYAHLQATKPDTIGAALNQSPVSLAAYILEKFSSWTHRDNLHQPDGSLLQQHFPISLDAMLDNICIYWFTSSITTSVRFYSEVMNKNMFTRSLDNNPCRVPAGFAVFPQEIMTLPKNLVSHKFYNIVSFNDQPAGGHFAAMERPALLAADLHQFVNTVEKGT
ncbi:juvenile hormone epoxide hydrolase 1-like [Homarus americanus]|uniref:juvenile hormone epoxide hydrolase 1-like n=1 Tax=Homarus americanus TaxID=6706 RepID=UPI001C44901E|nr:juvenile hormone epoxide hydrolase 1-like [Homarus americanus]XP_042223743.1 juvenile hormone epoxide hydrolase 1-like [Homarus americanus]